MRQELEGMAGGGTVDGVCAIIQQKMFHNCHPFKENKFVFVVKLNELRSL